VIDSAIRKAISTAMIDSVPIAQRPSTTSSGKAAHVNFLFSAGQLFWRQHTGEKTVHLKIF
jgi:hypothetical protein